MEVVKGTALRVPKLSSRFKLGSLKRPQGLSRDFMANYWSLGL